MTKKKLTINKRPDGKYVSLKFPSRHGSVWITLREYQTLQLLMAEDSGWNKASAELIPLIQEDK